MTNPNYSTTELENNRSPLEGALFTHLREYYPGIGNTEEDEVKEGAD